MTSLTLSPESRIRLPDVKEVLDNGYAVHAADDPALAGKHQQRLAIAVMDRFLSLSAPPGTAEDAYLATARAVALSFGRSLTRRKEVYIAGLRAANEERERRRNQINEVRKASDTLAVIWRFVGPATLGLVGYLTAQVIAPLVPTEISGPTGTKIPSLVTALLFMLVGRSVSLWASNLRRNRVENEYNARCFLVHLAYETGKLIEYHQYRAQLCEAWLQYTGDKYPETASYAMIIEGDIETRKTLEQHLQEANQNDISLVIRAVRRVLRRTTPPTPPNDECLELPHASRWLGKGR